MSASKRIINYTQVVLFASLLLLQFSCKKYLDKKPDQTLAVPSTLDDLQRLLDAGQVNGSPGYAELVADNFYLTDARWGIAGAGERLSYIWDRDAMPGYSYVWNNAYSSVYTANFVLDYLPGISITPSEHARRDRIKGAALYFRAYQFYQTAQLFCKPYSNSSSSDAGIVLRLTSGVAGRSVRATVQETYDQVVGDLKTAADLLPDVESFNTRPTRPAAYALLARVYLSMRDYANAKVYAEKSLAIKNTLLDYNTRASSGYTLPLFLSNPEILCMAQAVIPDELKAPNAIIDTTLYASYSSDDLRKIVFFQPNGSKFSWKGCYMPDAGVGPDRIMDGLCVDEVYLILAECEARAGHKDAAMMALNTLLRARWKTGLFNDLTAIDAADALDQVLIERRKELLFRNLRWSDLRRFNLEGANITLKRIINGTSYTLPPNDLRWVLLIPDLETSRSGIPQNPR